MTRLRSRRPLDDPEVLELLVDEPELLAISDAIAATQQRPRSRRTFAMASTATAAAIAALSFYGLLAGGDALADRALAAVGSGPLLHLVAERDDLSEILVDPSSGRARPSRIQLEVWLDTTTGRTRSATSRNGVVVADLITQRASVADEQTHAPGGLAVLRFGSGYRPALRSGALSEVREETVHGRRAVVTRVRLPEGGTELVTLDAETEIPLSFKADTAAAPAWRVLRMSSGPRRPDVFDPRSTEPRLSSGRVAASGRASAASAAEALPGAVWVGARLGTLALERVRLEQLEGRTAAGAYTRLVGVRLVYARGRARVEVQQSARPEPAYGFADGRWTFNFGPVPDDAVALTRLRGSPAPLWLAQVQQGDVFVSIRSTTRALALATARALRPIR